MACNRRTTYRIVRMYRSGKKSRTLQRGLTLEQAQAHCRNPETSSRTCQETRNVAHTSRYGAWFDGYE